MIDPVPRRYNRKNLFCVASALEDLSVFPFFGTLLGLVREGDIIKNDDDIDLYVDMRFRDAVVARMVANGFVFDDGQWPNTTPYFLQFKRDFGDTTTYVDVYLYDNLPESDFIVERWHFLGQPHDEKNFLHIDKKLIFPLRERRFHGKRLFLPARPKRCCEFLYGETWSQRISKSSGQYRMTMFGHRPVLVRRPSFALEMLQQCDRLEAEVQDLRQQNATLMATLDQVRAEQVPVARHEDVVLRIEQSEAARQEAEREAAVRHESIMLRIEQSEAARQEAEREAVVRHESILLRMEQDDTARRKAEREADAKLEGASAQVEHVKAEIARQIDAMHRQVSQAVSAATSGREMLHTLGHRLEREWARERERVLDTLQEQARAARGAPQGRFHRSGSNDGAGQMLKAAAKRLRRLGFDTDSYLRDNPDVLTKGLDPAEHYLLHGRDEGRRASFLPEPS